MENKSLNPDVDTYIHNAARWQEEMKLLRTIILGCGLKEEIKWGKPCYTFKGKNIVLIQNFKKYCALLFFNGHLLKDPNGILVKTGENTVVGRQIRFTGTREINDMENTLKAYIDEAIH